MIATLQAIHTNTVSKAANRLDRNVVLDNRAPPIDNTHNYITQKEHATIAQIMGSYKSRIKNVCTDYGKSPHDVKLLFVSPGSSDDIDIMRFMEQIKGLHPGTHLSRGDSPKHELKVEQQPIDVTAPPPPVFNNSG